MALTKKNIIIGAARVFLGPSVSATANLGASRPPETAGTRYSTTLDSATYTPGAAANTAAAWREVGYTQDGLEVSSDPSWGEVEVDQLLDAAKIFKDGMSFNISTTFAEATLENLLIAWGQTEATLSSGANFKELSIEGGNLGEAPLERGLIACGNAPENANSNTYGERVYQAYRVLSVEATSVSSARAEAAVVPVTLRALPADNGKYGIVRDRFNVS